MKARLFSLLVFQLLCVLCSTTADDHDCPCSRGQYCRKVGSTYKCVDCNRCDGGAGGLGATKLCSNFNDTVCELCANDSFSSLSVADSAYLCYPCTKCEPDRVTIYNCSSLVDTICGPCPRGMFLWDNGTCLDCSPCPQVDVALAIRYIECGVNGAPQDHMCAPGACSNCEDNSADVRVNVSAEGGFYPIYTEKIHLQGTSKPTASALLPAVSISMAIGVGLLIIFVTAFTVWLLHGMYCKDYRRLRRRHRRGQRGDHGDDELLIGMSEIAEEAPGEGNTSVMAGATTTMQYGELGRHARPSFGLLEIIGFVKEVAFKWYAFADALGVSRDIIDQTDLTCDGDSARCCEAVLVTWLKGADCSWNNIIEACQKVSLHSLATKLKIFFTSSKTFCESDVVLWDYLVDQIRRVWEKRCIMPKWCLYPNNALLQLMVTIQGRSLMLEDAIMLVTEDHPRPVVLLGGPGAGKTTMALQLAQNWCRTGSDSHFALVIYVDMLKHADRVTDLASLISLHLERPPNAEMLSSMCDVLMRQEGEGLLLILDGFDELRRGVPNTFIDELLQFSVLPKCSLLLACQPGFAFNVQHSVEITELPLLRYEQVQHYVQDSVGPRHLALIRSSLVWPMMHNPLMLAIACKLLRHDMEVTQLNTLTQLYYNLVIKLVSDEVRKLSYSAEHSSVVRALLTSCAEASYKAMLQSQCAIDGITDVKVFLNSGLVEEYDGTLYFTHNTFLEFFAAYHIAHSLNSDKRGIRVDPNASLFLPFLSGLTGQIPYKTEETGNNSLVFASICYSEAKSPIRSGPEHTVMDTSFPCDLVATVSGHTGVFTPHQLTALKTFVQDNGITTLNLSGLKIEMLDSTLSSIANLHGDADKTTGITKRYLYDLLNCKTVAHVNAVNITISKEGWIAFAKILQNVSLTSLNLSHNQIADDGIIAAIIDSLKANVCLEFLQLSHCNLTSGLAGGIIESLLSNKKLQRLDLSSNLIKVVNIEMMNAVTQLGVVQVIDISDNPLDGEVLKLLRMDPQRCVKL